MKGLTGRLTTGNRLLWVLLVILLVFSLTLAARRAEAAPVKPIVFKHVAHDPITVKCCAVVVEMLDEMEKQTNGRVKFERYLGQTLVKAIEQTDAIQSGVADHGWVVTAYTPGRFPLYGILELPMGFRTSGKGARIAELMMGKYFKEEFEVRNAIRPGLSITTPAYYIVSKKPIRTLEDCQGKKIRAGGGTALGVTALGMTSVTMSVADLYLALQRGTIDGAALNFTNMGDYKIYEVAKYVTLFPLGCYAGSIAWNLNSWNSLSSDIQAILIRIEQEYTKKLARVAYDAPTLKDKEKCSQQGMEIIELSAEEFQRFETAVSPVWEKWAADREKQGLPGKAALKEFRGLLTEVPEWKP